MAQRRTKAEWARKVDEYQRSGQSRAEFCKAHGLNPKTFGHYLVGKRDSKDKRSAGEWEVLINEQKSSGIGQFEWCRNNGVPIGAMSSAIRRMKEREQVSASKVKWAQLRPEIKEEVANRTTKIRINNLEIELDANYPVEQLAVVLERLAKQC